MPAALALLLSLIGPLAADAEEGRFAYEERHMGVGWKLILYAPDQETADRAAKAVFARVEELNGILSDYDPESELSRLSQTAGSGRPVPVSDELWRVLETSQSLARQSGGAFDITLGPVIRQWRRARRTGKIPPADELTAARGLVGHTLLQLDPIGRTARLDKADMRLDLGGIAMGYAVDESLRVLHDMGITRALLDASGDIGVTDPPPGAAGWRIEVAPPGGAETNQPSKAAPIVLILANAAVTTSGDLYQHVEIDGRRYSHIVDPRTGLGLTDRSNVTVVADTCMAADSLATAASVLGPQAGLRLIEATPHAEAQFLRQPAETLETVRSSGWKHLVQPPPDANHVR
ncbi:MAG: FAD:protein FMN transferase [Pirellulales bacterium]